MHLDEAMRDDDARTSRTALNVVEADLPPRFVHEAANVISESKRQLSALAELLSLRPRIESRRRVCRALITAELNGLTDATSSRLRGFGDVDPSVAERLDPPLEQLRASVARLADLLA
jgi:hypothetical protein